MDIQTLSLLVTSASVTAAAAYYIVSIRTTNKTRQAQLLMQIYSIYTTENFHSDFTKIRTWDFQGYDDFMVKYGDSETIAFVNHLVAYLEGVGTLVYRGFINPVYIDDLMSNYVFTIWEKLRPLILEAREKRKQPEIFDKTEYLYNRLIGIYEKEHGFKFNGIPLKIRDNHEREQVNLLEEMRPRATRAEL